ncbi:hypothetical protein NQ317_008618 [Molorchus minor]|uniref:E3 SUMO-protein ligase RanBP2 n=1 Tax=Molorchus minor TaxID=1323400 RepID=A0ABQ9IZX1_9CUCU|nr:hypothetical protein NQ317_008618 [Molorchus minor]
MADQKTSQSKENVTSEMRSQNIILLSRARDCLYLTLDRLREPSIDRSHPLNAQLGTEIEKMERLLSRIDPDCTNRNECDGMSDENPSSDNSVADHYLTTYTHASFHNGLSYTKNDSQNIHSTPLRHNVTRQEARPSPERLDAQIRQMAATRDTALNNILEQNKIMVDSHRSLLEELRSFKDAVNNLTSTVEDLKSMKKGFEELKNVKKSVDELKNSVDELQNVVDVVQEMKKEINELKKDQSKNNQLSDEDLYVLDPDYGVDYNINSNIGNYNPNIPSLYPNYQPGRVGATNALPYGPPGLYPGLYPGLAYAYGGLGLPQPGRVTSFCARPGITINYSHPCLPSANSGSTASYPGLATYQSRCQHAHWTSISSRNTSVRYAIKGIPKQGSSSTVSTVQSMFPSVPSTITSSAPGTAVSSKAAPVNVVITTSDPLPTNKTLTTQPILSVTIPPQHIKGNVPKSQPHNYQIPLPSSGITTIASTPSILSQPPPAISTQSMLSNVAPPIFSSLPQNKTPQKNVSLGLQIEKTLDETFSPSNRSLNKSNISSSSLEEHDPCPDFKPIIPLPDEVPINTGEECETHLFCERAKLFRHVNNNGVKEWKERGVGNLKILNNAETGKVRILMRRDQVHKICANHFITKNMVLTPMANNDRAYIWAAMDFADEEVVLEKFCVKFKTAEEAKKFYDCFESSKKLIGTKQLIGTELQKTEDKPEPARFTVSSSGTPNPATTSLGGFVFTSTPTFKPKDISMPFTNTTEVEEKKQSSPFSTFTFGKSTVQSPSLFKTDFKPVETTEATTFSPLVIPQSKIITPQKHEHEIDARSEDFVPTAEFKPVIALPDLVEVKTGEENSEILFECRAKLFRYDTSGETKEWKERGVGIIKILKDDSIRLVMRRDQVHKVCCNHKVLKNMTFKVNTNNPKAIAWHAQDFSEGVLTPETFTVRFKTEEQAQLFLQTVQSAQTSLDENNTVSSKHHKAEIRPRTTSFGDKFKMAKGSWECKNCYIVNDCKNTHCVACETPKSGSSGKTPDSGRSGPVFSFGIATTQPSVTTETAKSGQSFGAKPMTTTWGNAFKPAEGSWECRTCCVRNSSDKTKCAACDGPKEGVVSTSDKPAPKGISLDTPGQKFSFGIPATAKQEKTKPVMSGFGDTFKPKAGSWECQMCFVRNNADVIYCASCEAPKDNSVPKKETATSINLDTPGQKFTFGMPQAAMPAADTTKSFSFGSAQFSFGANLETKPANIFKAPETTVFSFKPATPTTTTTVAKGKDEKFVFGSPQKHDFEFKPRSPRRISAGQGDEESDGSYVDEEEDNIYFKPVIPLPDKVEVKTGEEDEAVLYCHRAKLFRFVTGEWKERGLGDVKILKRKDTEKLRVVMRREQVLKICLNHTLNKDIEYIAKDDKTWLFHAADFSEGEVAHEQFCIRFKTPEIAQEFKKAVTDALNTTETSEADKKAEPLKTEDTDDEVIIVSETKVTPEEEKEAIKLGLPPKFLSYKQLPDCTCKQCKKDDEYLKELYTDKKIVSVDTSTPRPKSSTNSVFATPTSGVTTPSSGGSLFETPKEQTSFSFSPSQPGGKSSSSLRELLLKPPKLDAASPSSEDTNMSSKTAISLATIVGKTQENSAIKNFSFSSPNFSFGNTTSSSTATPTSNIFNSNTANIFSGSGNLLSATSTSSSSIFSTNTTSIANIFGNSASTAGSIFSSTTPAFGSMTSTSGNIFESTPTGTSSATPIGTGSIFGAKPVFGTTPVFDTTNTGKIFSITPASTVSSSTTASIFSTSNVATTNTTTTGSIFSITPSTTTSIFNAKTTTSSVFGSTPTTNLFSQTTSGNIFGQNATGGNLFGPKPPGTNLFGAMTTSSGTNSTSSPLVTTSNIFGGTQSNPIFGTKATPVFGTATTANVFGSKPAVTTESKLEFGTVAAQGANKSTTELKEDDELVLKCDSGLSFALLAANTTSDTPPAFTSKTGENNFAFLGAGAPVFGSKQKDTKKRDKSKADNSKSDSIDEGGDGHEDEEYDPHYEPVVPLPEAIVVSTGEEDEDVVFNERAKLFRFDANTKEWKERGVGQIKVLHHPQNNTYRLLLRREQVHKVVLNQLILPNLELQPMMTSDKAWMWAGYNYTEDENSLEKLAVRFKNEELAKQFYNAVQGVLKKLQELQSNKALPSPVQNYGTEDISSADEENNAEGGNNEEDDDEDEDDDERSVMFMKRCTLSELHPDNTWNQVTMGDLQVYYDPELYAARIAVNDDTGNVFSNTLIGMNTPMDINKNECTWKAVEWAEGDMSWRTLKATFSSEVAAQEFHSNYLEGLNYAQEVGIIDEIPHENNTEDED